MCDRVRPRAVRATVGAMCAVCDRVGRVRCVRPCVRYVRPCVRYVRPLAPCAPCAIVGAVCAVCDRVRCVWCVRSCATACAIRATGGAVCAVCDRVRPLAQGGLGWAYGWVPILGPLDRVTFDSSQFAS